MYTNTLSSLCTSYCTLQVGRSDIKKYTGINDLPVCEITFKSDERSPRDLHLTVTLSGICKPNDKFELTMKADKGKVYVYVTDRFATAGPI